MTTKCCPNYYLILMFNIKAPKNHFAFKLKNHFIFLFIPYF